MNSKKRILVALFLLNCAPNVHSTMNCASLNDAQLENIELVAEKCAGAKEVAKAADATYLLDVSPLSQGQFNKLFKNVEILGVALKAHNSRIKTMKFPKLTSIQDNRHKLLLDIKDNRILENVSMPNVAELHSFDDSMSVSIRSNPILAFDDVKAVYKKIHNHSMVKFVELNNEEGVCTFTDIVSNLADLDNCKKVDGHLVIDQAHGVSTARIEQVTGCIRIMYSGSLRSIDFVNLGRGGEHCYTQDEIIDNPLLCLSANHQKALQMRIPHKKPIIYGNSICPNENTCLGGDLSSEFVRQGIETSKCSTILGDLVLNRFITNSSSLSANLRGRLSRIQTILNGSLVIINNQGLTSLDFFKNIIRIRLPRDRKCTELSYSYPGVVIWANYGLEKVELNPKLQIQTAADSDCKKLVIGANGKDGKDFEMTEDQMRHFENTLGYSKVEQWYHPLGLLAQRNRELWKQQQKPALVVFTAYFIMPFLCCVAALYYASNMLILKRKERKRPKVPKNGRNPVDGGNHEKKKNRGEIGKQPNGRFVVTKPEGKEAKPKKIPSKQQSMAKSEKKHGKKKDSNGVKCSRIEKSSVKRQPSEENKTKKLKGSNRRKGEKVRSQKKKA